MKYVYLDEHLCTYIFSACSVILQCKCTLYICRLNSFVSISLTSIM